MAQQFSGMTSQQLMMMARKLREEEKKAEQKTLREEIIFKMDTPAFKNLKKGEATKEWIIKNIFGVVYFYKFA